ncbi:MAG: 1-acyl-sn-glycerol-3-phosphate acyltransferase [Bacteroidales bacterium]|nr:1-acyl-sn-glycerol-3-phosphate acyltransferase [Bacteroidales bacterium]
MSRWGKFCGWLLKKMGWTTVGGPVPDKKAIILGVPHTSFMDFVVSYLFYTQFDAQKAHVMIKKEFFFWPIGPLLRAMGGIPVDRSNAAALVKSLIEQMENKDSFVLAIAPEGTRKAVKKWKTGYHLIAKSAGCPVYMGYFDWGRKRVSRGEIVELTADARADTDRIQALYEEMHLQGKHPEGFITH